MATYLSPNSANYSGRSGTGSDYIHEQIQLVDLNEDFPKIQEKSVGILGYACDEGVRRNQGRVGAVEGPDAIRSQFAKLPIHSNKKSLLDTGTISCADTDLEGAQQLTAEKVYQLLKHNVFPILLGGGHDIAWGHFMGIHTFLWQSEQIGIINFDAHLDLRKPGPQGNSGTPFLQIARHVQNAGQKFHYLCLGARKDANSQVLLQTAEELSVDIVFRENFHLDQFLQLVEKLNGFLKGVDRVYVTIDLDGFSSAYAPGVSAPSPLGFDTDIVLSCLEKIFESKKVISLDIAEMNPEYDQDNQTAKLAAGLMHQIIHWI
ncbi:MAG: formimidoylglutamase [Bacteroidia bacterium]|nr:formimidoylglutamase [Bacteroidia bacterium]